jgi:hypothetical protein
MSWHVHYKDGKFNVWSSVVDAYILPEWTTDLAIENLYAEHAAKEALRVARENIANARGDGCSLLRPFRCETIPD